MSFQEILEFLNFLYSVGMLLEFAAYIRLRIKKPDLHRPYKVPLQTFGATMLCLPPALLLALVMCLASLKTYLVSAGVIIFGFLLYPALLFIKYQNWARFKATEPVALSDNDPEEQPIESQHPQEIADEASVGLLSHLQSSKVEQAPQMSSEEVPKLV